jgi:clan AA aspartic protease (TIGR02281 family)
MLTVRWPLFARLEALLLFPVALLAASEIAQVRTIVERWIAPALAPPVARLGLPIQVALWAAMAIVVIVPYLIVLIVADRLLTVRKGFALLSIVAIAAWYWAAMHFADHLASLLPEPVVNAVSWRPFDTEAAIAAGSLAFLLHLRPLWVGIRDQGDVAMRLIAAREERAFRPGPAHDPRRVQDVYYRQTAEFRDWRAREQFDGLAGAPRESTAVRFLSALTWMTVIAGAGFAWHNWDNLAIPAAEPGKAVPPPPPAIIVSGPPSAAHGVPATAPVAVPTTAPVAAPVAAPRLPLSPLPAPAVSRPMTTSALPEVQRPTEMSANGRGSSVYVGANEAVAERGPDGGFAFDAVVNGSHVRMLFDTGASVVVLRAEDAERIGINMNRLIYSAKVKTANGVADVAPVMIDTMLVGNITLRNVIGCVAKPGVLQQNLLGQAFLARLAGFNVENNQLVLRGH